MEGFRLNKSVTFEAAHRLADHRGKCWNLHGHSYTVVLTVTGKDLRTEGSEAGMVLDFSVLSDICQKIRDTYDHSVILAYDDELARMISRSDLHTMRMHLLDGPPTSEVLARRIADQARNLLQTAKPGVRLYKVRVGETCTSACDYYPGKP